MTYSLIEDAKKNRERYGELGVTPFDVIPGLRMLRAPVFSHYLGVLLHSLQEIADAVRAVGSVDRLMLQNTYVIELDLDLGKDWNLQMRRLADYVSDRIVELAHALGKEVERFNSSQIVALTGTKPSTTDVEAALAGYIKGFNDGS